MGQRGPPPLPSSILRLRGSRRISQRQAEVAPPPGGVYPPYQLDAYAQATWTRLVKVLGCVTRLDVNTLARYCDLASRYRKASDYLRDNGSTYERRTPHGVRRAKRPEVSILKDLAALLHRLEAEFGMTPSSRARISTGKVTEDFDKSAFFSLSK